MKESEIQDRVDKLESKLKYKFRDKELIKLSLIHSSYANESEEAMPDNDRLEYLGDAVLDIVVGETIYKNYPEYTSGNLTKLRAALVNMNELARVAKDIDLGPILLLGVGEQRSGGASKESLLSSAYEAVIGAVYLDGGLSAAQDCIGRQVLTRLTYHAAHLEMGDSKSGLQEYCAAKKMGRPRYNLLERTGPDHDTTFTIECILKDKKIGEGRGRSIKLAEQAAAKEALASIMKEKD